MSFSSIGLSLEVFQRITHLPENGILNTIQNQKGDEQILSHSISRLIFALAPSERFQDKNEIYESIFQLLPYHNVDQFQQLLERLPTLLGSSLQLREQQEKLACALAQWYIKQAQPLPLSLQLSYYINAMHYLGRAILIGENRDTYLLASKLFGLIIRKYLVSDKSFRNFLDTEKRKNDSQRFKERFLQIENLKQFCCEEKDKKEIIEELYDQAINVFNTIPTKELEKYPVRLEVGDNMSKPFSLPESLPIQRYKNGLVKFRKVFDNFQTTNLFREQVFEEFKAFFQTLSTDIMSIIGPAPCGYDIRAMGSVGRKEICPYSDLEFFILIQKENEETFNYFKMFGQILDLQVASLGEVPGALALDFTYLDPTEIKGFYIDQSPAKDSQLIREPAAMASLLKADDLDGPTSFQNTILRSSSLICSDASLFTSYTNTIRDMINEKNENLLTLGQEQALQFFASRYQDYKDKWSKPFSREDVKLDLKEHYIELLNHLLSDMARYWQIEKVDLHEIIDALVEKQIFTSQSSLLLHDSVNTIYRIRVACHRHHRQQKEKVFFKREMGSQREYILKAQEIEDLEKIYWLVLKPLYFRMKTVIHNKSAPEKVFHQIELVQISFEEGIYILAKDLSIEKLKPLIFHLASFLQSIKAPLEEHVKYYQNLSNLPELTLLRQTYFESLDDSTLTEELASIPDRAGFRYSFSRANEKLSQAIDGITTEKETSEVKVIFHSKKKYLHPQVAKQILDEKRKGEVKHSYLTSAHHVSSAQFNSHQLHFKMNPTQPLMEYAIYNLFYRMTGRLTPAVQLVRFELSEKVYPVLISETISGITLKESIPSNPDWSRWTWMLLCLALTRPGDGRLSNYLTDPGGNVFCVDNDLSFAELVIKDGLFSTKVCFNSALFCLFPDRPLSEEVLQQFCQLQFDLILNAWITDIIKEEKKYLSLFNEKERRDLYKEGKSLESSILTVLFREGVVITLYLQFWQLQNHISKILREKKKLFPCDLLAQLINLREGFQIESLEGGKVVKAYREAIAKTSVIEERLKLATSSRQAGSLTLVQFQKIALNTTPTFEQIEAGEYSPERASKELLAILLRSNSKVVRTENKEGKITIQANFGLLFIGKRADKARQELVLKALQHQIKIKKEKPDFVSLKKCDILNIKNLEVFLHEKLEILTFYKCAGIDNNIIREINARCPNLKEFYLIKCSNVNSFSTKLWNGLLYFRCLETLQIIGNSRLQIVKMKSPLLKSLVLSNNENLEIVDISTDAFPLISFDGSPRVEFHISDLQDICKIEEDFKRVKKCYEQLLSFCKLKHSQEVELKEAVLLNNLGWASNNLKDYQQATEYYEKALSSYRSIYKNEPHEDILTVLHNLQVIHEKLGNDQAAARYSEDSKNMFMQIHGYHPDKPLPAIGSSW